jgi:hypothetical protein
VRVSISTRPIHCSHGQPMKARPASALVLVGLTACVGTMAEVGGQPTPGGPSCYGSSSLPWEQPQIGITAMRVANADYQFSGLFPNAAKDDDADPAVADQAALDFNCPVANVWVAKRRTADFAWSVEACGRHSAYVAVERSVTTSGAPGHEGRCLVMETVRFVRLDGDPAAAIERMDATYNGPQPAADSHESVFGSVENVSRVRNWGALVDQASKDLACPRDELVPGFWASGRTTTPIAEGCGQRATYLPGFAPPFMMQSLVRVTRQ